MQYYLILVRVTWSQKAKTNLSKAYSHSHYFLNKKIIKGRKEEKDLTLQEFSINEQFIYIPSPNNLNHLVSLKSL